MSGFGDWLGNLGSSWQGGEDAPMYADPGASLDNPGYATTLGVSNYGSAVGGLFTQGLLLFAGIGIIAVTLLNAGDD